MEENEEVLRAMSLLNQLPFGNFLLQTWTKRELNHHLTVLLSIHNFPFLRLNVVDVDGIHLSNGHYSIVSLIFRRTCCRGTERSGLFAMDPNQLFGSACPTLGTLLDPFGPFWTLLDPFGQSKNQLFSFHHNFIISCYPKLLC